MQFSVFDAPVKVYGIPLFEKNRKLERYPEDLRKKLTDNYPEVDAPQLTHLTTRTMGARAAFRTDSENISIEMKLKTLEHDVGMSMFSCSSGAVYTGRGESFSYKGLMLPHFDDMTGRISFTKDKTVEDVMIYFPRNEIVENIIISLDDEAVILPPTPYKYEKPVVYFGSSITEGGHAALITNAYTELLSHRLDFDYYNLGISGNCRGQLEVAEFICSLEPGVFVFDYDHNAPTADFLRKTHEPFFKYVREKMPSLPVLLMSAPNYESMPERDERRAIIRETFENAVKNGDENVYFLDGKDFFGEEDRELCTTDTVHPNDYGFHKMARVIEPVLKNILENL